MEAVCGGSFLTCITKWQEKYKLKSKKKISYLSFILVSWDVQKLPWDGVPSPPPSSLVAAFSDTSLKNIISWSVAVCDVWCGVVWVRCGVGVCLVAHLLEGMRRWGGDVRCK